MFGEPGKRKRRSFFGVTAEEARRKLTAAQAQQDAGFAPPSERESVSSYMKAWLAAKRPSLRPETYRRYKDLTELHLLPELGRFKLSKLTATQIEAAYTALRAKGLSGTTIRHAHGVLRKSIQDALRRGEVVRNACDLLDAPRRSTGEMRVLTPDECQRLLEAAKGDDYEALFVVALTTGARLGELQGLRWAFVDLDARRMTIAATLAGVENGKPLLAPPKTARSKRTVRLSAMAIEALRRHRAAQVEHRLRVGGLYHDHDLVFTTGYGSPVDGNNLRTRAFARLLKRAGLEPMRFHTLRHSAATLLMGAGVPVKVASELLGHSDIATTLRVYSHVLEPMHDAAADAMDKIFAAK